MSSEELLCIDTQELKFPFELKKQISCSFQLLNKTDNHVAFKVKTTDPKNYCVRPNYGVVLPRSTSTVIVTMQAQREAPPKMQCKDKFLVQSVVVPPGSATKYIITPQMFNKEAGNHVKECKLRVAYVSPPLLRRLRQWRRRTGVAAASFFCGLVCSSCVRTNGQEL